MKDTAYTNAKAEVISKYFFSAFEEPGNLHVIEGDEGP